MRGRLSGSMGVALVLVVSSAACGGGSDDATPAAPDGAVDGASDSGTDSGTLDAAADATAESASDALPAVATAIAAGTGHTCAVIAGGTPKCWGWNVVGQLGDGSTADRLAAVSVTGLASGVVSLATGYAHTCVVTPEGIAQCWGLNDNGQLGDGSIVQRHVPTPAKGLPSSVTAIATGYSHTCALTSGGGVLCWGSNAYGQLGDGSTMERHAPVPVSGLSSGVIAIAAGSYHTCALTSSGGVSCWGWNELGQLGDGSTMERHAPTPVVGLSSGVASIATGQRHTCAVTTGGSLQCWGFNGFGQLGDGSMTQRNAPVPVPGLSGLEAVACGGDHTCALSTAGAVQCWGDNTAGQVGDGTMVMRRPTPVPVSGLSSGVLTIALPNSGGGQSCAVLSGGAVQCWGYNLKGQIGDGTTMNRLVPTPVVGFP